MKYIYTNIQPNIDKNINTHISEGNIDLITPVSYVTHFDNIISHLLLPKYIYQYSTYIYIV